MLWEIIRFLLKVENTLISSEDILDASGHLFVDVLHDSFILLISREWLATSMDNLRNLAYVNSLILVGCLRLSRQHRPALRRTTLFKVLESIGPLLDFPLDIFLSFRIVGFHF